VTVAVAVLGNSSGNSRNSSNGGSTSRRNKFIKLVKIIKRIVNIYISTQAQLEWVGSSRRLWSVTGAQAWSMGQYVGPVGAPIQLRQDQGVEGAGGQR
jgi:hypothetical protein